MKKLINGVESIIPDALRGLALAHPGLVHVDLEHRMVLRADAPRPGKVALISGGGAGHEPLHTGYVGLGMLDAACVGEIFTSPTPDQILAATLATDRGAGALYVVKNYTGDVMNFEMASEFASDSGVRVESVLVDDDVAVEDSTHTAGRRGVGLTVLLEKLVGAASEQGRDLDACLALTRSIVGRGRSMGVALTSCTVPAVGAPTVDLADDEMELGVGIHGEPGRERLPLASAHDIARMLVAPVVDDLELSGDLRGRPAIVMLSGLGATPSLELYLVWAEVADALRARGVQVARNLVGTHITSLDMAGCAVTVLAADGELLRLWDAPVRTAGLRWGA